MPSPVGHTLAAVAAGWIVAPPAGAWRPLGIQVALLGGLASAPDLDLLWGRHSAETHSVGAAIVAGAIAAWGRWPIATTRSRIFLAAFLAWFTHPIVDALGTDDSVPLGVMMWWPFSTIHVYPAWEVFGSISRYVYRDDFLPQNLFAVLRELAILGPLAMAVWWARRPSRVG